MFHQRNFIRIQPELGGNHHDRQGSHLQPHSIQWRGVVPWWFYKKIQTGPQRVLLFATTSTGDHHRHAFGHSGLQTHVSTFHPLINSMVSHPVFIRSRDGSRKARKCSSTTPPKLGTSAI